MRVELYVLQYRLRCVLGHLASLHSDDAVLHLAMLALGELSHVFLCPAAFLRFHSIVAFCYSVIINIEAAHAAGVSPAPWVWTHSSASASSPSFSNSTLTSKFTFPKSTSSTSFLAKNGRLSIDSAWGHSTRTAEPLPSSGSARG